MKWTYSRVPACFHCRHFIGWPYCRYFKDGIPPDIQYGAIEQCLQYQVRPAAPAGMLQRVRDMLQRADRR